MPNSFTANLSLELPQVGADSNLWGGHLNSDLTILDGIFSATSTRPISMILKSDSSMIDATVTTKAIKLILSSITAATTRNLTVQDADGTLAYTAQIATATTGFATTGDVAAATSTTVIMDLTSVQTAINKTLTAPLLTGILAASTGVTTTANDNSTKLATTAYVDRQAPGASPITNSLSGDVALNNTSNFFDGPSVAQGSTGTWLATGTVTVGGSATNAGDVWFAKLWDGTSVIASTQITYEGASGAPTQAKVIALSGFLASPAGNLRISVRCTTNTSSKILFDASGASADSTITAIRIA